MNLHTACRNGMMGASFQSTIAALFFNVLLDVLLSPSQLRTLQRYAEADPLLEPTAVDFAPINGTGSGAGSSTGASVRLLL